MQRPPISRRAFIRTGGLSASALYGIPGALGTTSGSSLPDLNVLLVLVDDLRTELGCYGSARVRTPHIDRIADSGLTFLRCYCQQAASNPSRTSLLTGLRPDTTRVYDGRTHFRRALPRVVTLPEHFKRHGYETAAFGKIFESPALEDLRSWSMAPWIPGRARLAQQGKRGVSAVQLETAESQCLASVGRFRPSSRGR